MIQEKKTEWGWGEPNWAEEQYLLLAPLMEENKRVFFMGKISSGYTAQEKSRSKGIGQQSNVSFHFLLLQLLISYSWTFISAWMLWIYMSSFAGPLRVDRHCWLRLVSDSVVVEHSHFAHNVHNQIVCTDNNTVVAMILLSVEINILVLWSDQ